MGKLERVPEEESGVAQIADERRLLLGHWS
jgi:hypothetical protein